MPYRGYSALHGMNPNEKKSLLETFYFIKISYVLAVLLIFFNFVWCFLSKKSHFQLKQLCNNSVTFSFSELLYIFLSMSKCNLILSYLSEVLDIWEFFNSELQKTHFHTFYTLTLLLLRRIVLNDFILIFFWFCFTVFYLCFRL